MKSFYFYTPINQQVRLPAVRKVAETIVFQLLGIFVTLGSKISHGTLKKFADVRTHLRKVSKNKYIKKRSIFIERFHCLFITLITDNKAVFLFA